MSCYSTMSGHGQLSKRTFGNLRTVDRGISRHSGIQARRVEEVGVPVKATSRTHEFYSSQLIRAPMVQERRFLSMACLPSIQRYAPSTSH